MTRMSIAFTLLLVSVGVLPGPAAKVYAGGPESTIIVVKETQGGDGTFEFESELLGDFSITTVSGTGEITFADIASGQTYEITEIVPPGWQFDGIVCNHGPQTVTVINGTTVAIDLGEEDVATCTFTNIQDTDSVLVHKECVPPDAGGQFEITLLDDMGNDAIADQNPITVGCGETATFTGVEEGTYSAVEEIIQGDFQETSNDCQNLDLDIALPPPECTIENTQSEPGSVTIVKQTIGGDGTFSFTTSDNLDPDSFDITTVSGSGSFLFADLEDGTYEVTEIVPGGWDFVGIECEGGEETFFDIQGTTVGIDLVNGEDVTCTFTNRALPEPAGTIVIEKSIDNSDGTFSFSGDLGNFDISAMEGVPASETFPDLAPGSYDVTEIVPADFELAGISCDDDDSTTDLNTQTAHIELADGETMTCTFTNRFNVPVMEPAAIPTLSRPSMIVLMLLLALAAVWVLVPERLA